MMKTFLRHSFYLLLASAVFAGCKKKDQVDDFASKYKYPIAPVKLTRAANVGVYYYNYTSTDWGKKQADTSLLGKPYNVLTDATVFPQQMKWADQGGVDFFILKWDAATTDNSLLSAFASSRTTQKVKMVIDFNTAHLKATNASPLTGAKLTTMLNEFKTLVQNHISKDYYYKIDNRPVILLSPLNLSSSALTSIDFKYVTDTLRTELKKQGVDPFIIGELTTGWTAPVNYDQSALGAMDAIVLTTWNTSDYDRWWAFYSYSDLNWKNWKTTLEKINVQFVPCIFPGYKEPGSTSQRVIERTEANYVDYMNVAKANMGKDQIILINSWNDFVKGTSLEPSVNYDTKYLELTQRDLKVP